MSRTQIMAPQEQGYTQYQPQRSTDAAPTRSRAAVVTLGIVRGLLVMLLAALIASAIKRHHYANHSAATVTVVRIVNTGGAYGDRTAPGRVALDDRPPTSVEHDQTIDHAMTEGLTR
jgi:hypothetical protein